MPDHHKVGGGGEGVGGGCRGSTINMTNMMTVLKEWRESHVLKLYNLYKYKNGEKVQ